MTYYIVLSPYSGKWLRAPYKGFADDRSEAHPYPANDQHLASMAHTARKHGCKLRLRQVMVAEDA